MDVKLINPFLSSTRHAFAEMVHIPLSVGRPYLRSDDDRIYKLFQVSGVIDLSGPVTGKIAVSFSAPTSRAVAGAMLGSEVSELGEECYDAIRELTNVIAGGAKAMIASGDVPVSLGIPKAIPSQEMDYPAGQPVLIIPFDTPAGRMLMQVMIVSKSPSSSSTYPTGADAWAAAGFRVRSS